MNTLKSLAGKDPEHEVKAENEPVSSTGFSQKPLKEQVMGSEGKMKALHYDGAFKVSIKEIERPKASQACLPQPHSSICHLMVFREAC